MIWMKKTNAFFDGVEVVDDDSDEKVEGEKSAADDEDEEKVIQAQLVLPGGLLLKVIGHVYSMLHHFHPPFKRCLQTICTLHHGT